MHDKRFESKEHQVRNPSKKKAAKKKSRPARRRKGEEAKGRPSHIGRAGLRDNPLQHITRNTRNTSQVHCEGVRVVVGDEAPLGGVAQVIFHSVRVVEVGLQVREHQDRGGRRR